MSLLESPSHGLCRGLGRCFRGEFCQYYFDTMEAEHELRSGRHDPTIYLTLWAAL